MLEVSVDIGVRLQKNRSFVMWNVRNGSGSGNVELQSNGRTQSRDTGNGIGISCGRISVHACG